MGRKYKREQTTTGLDQLGYLHWMGEDELRHVKQTRINSAKKKHSIKRRANKSTGSRKPPITLAPVTIK